MTFATVAHYASLCGLNLLLPMTSSSHSDMSRLSALLDVHIYTMIIEGYIFTSK